MVLLVNVLSGFLLTLSVSAALTPREAPEPTPTPSPSPSPSPPAPSVQDLYRTVLPRPIGETEAVVATEVPGQAPGTGGPSHADGSRDTETRDGLYLGRTRITPSFHALYVRAD